ncbi:MAG: hypothetical protein ABIO70_34140 [Pseudomonadota bacterium]
MISLRRLRWPLCLLACLAALALALPATAWLRVLLDGDTPSRSVGSGAGARLEHGHVLPPIGRGHVTYSWLGSAIGRQYLHGRVRDLLVAATAEARGEHGCRYVIGETGWRRGGAFPPHATHRAGLSADVMMPMQVEGVCTHLPTWAWNLWGYAVDLDARGCRGGACADLAALARLVAALQRSGPEHGVRLTRVIIAHDLAAGLEAALRVEGARVIVVPASREGLQDHDDHVHLDFSLRD